MNSIKLIIKYCFPPVFPEVFPLSLPRHIKSNQIEVSPRASEALPIAFTRESPPREATPRKTNNATLTQSQPLYFKATA